MIKVLFIGSFLSKIQGTLGVSEVIASELSDRGYIVDICSNKKNKFLRLIEIVFRILLSDCNIIHIDVFSGPAYRIAEFSSFLAKVRNKRVIITLHGGMLPDFYIQNERRFLRLFQRCSLILTPSNYLKQFFEKQGFSVVYFPNSISLDKFPFNNEFVKSKSLLWVRAFNNIYCPEVAIESLRLVHKVYPETTITMIGPDKGNLMEIKHLVRKCGLEKHVNIVGPIPNSELYKYLWDHKIFLNTTKYESFGICVAEAASCGTPVISNEVGELPLIWENDKSICLVKDNDPKEFARCIIRVFEDSKYSNYLKINARNRVEEFSREGVVDKWIGLVQE